MKTMDVIRMELSKKDIPSLLMCGQYAYCVDDGKVYLKTKAGKLKSFVPDNEFEDAMGKVLVK